jgi:PAT family beta-lactamase induction signal transducer AmpG
VDKTSIGIFTLISLPYAISFIWSPILDHVKIPFFYKIFGLRFSWIISIQLSLSLAVYAISYINPLENLWLFSILGLLIAFLSSTQDVALGALRAEIIPKDRVGATSGIYILGYRIGMLVGSSGAIYASIYMEWSEIYRLFASLILYFPLILFVTSIKMVNNQAPQNDAINVMEVTFWQKALSHIGNTKLIITIVAFLILYRLPDNFISVMINPFLVETGFDAMQISTVGKFLGVMTAIVGGIIAGYVMKRMKIMDAILVFGAIHALSHLLFIAQNYYGANLYMLFVVVGIENITGGMVMAAYIAFITSLCQGKYSATQYAFLSSMMGISRSILPSLSGLIATIYGWNNFFLFITLITIPSLYIALRLRDKFKY